MLDEPFSALDSYLREEVEGEVAACWPGLRHGAARSPTTVTKPTACAGI